MQRLLVTWSKFLKKLLKCRSVANPRCSTVELDERSFSDLQMNLPSVMPNAEQKQSFVKDEL